MKNSAIKIFSLILILFLGSEILVSCKAKQPLKEITKETTDKTDFTSVKELTEINKEITDQLIWQLSQVRTSDPKCDSITKAYLFQVLNSMNTEKQSGDNAYSFKFNELLQRMELQVKLAETKNLSKDSIRTITTTIDHYKSIDKPVKIPLTWYEKALQYLGLLALLFVGYKIYSFIKSKAIIQKS